ncbi:MAG: TlyA family rRNA (cytidine-2'-O)-methyltransferase [Planctomycetota bacterium]|nr:MAG: TlyA family rRNA (cytidine-2'-O)-methyltransferase [Planctomycetota bacterium]
MSTPRHDDYVSRAGAKLAHALAAFRINPAGHVCADLGANTGGFTDCLIQHGAERVYAVERGYGVLDYRLRKNPRVIVLERTDALHVTLPEPVRVVTIDTGWTRQAVILPAARRLLVPGGSIVSLIKPHYEAPPEHLIDGVLPDGRGEEVIAPLRTMLASIGLELLGETESPIRGHGGNRECLWHLRPM